MADGALLGNIISIFIIVSLMAIVYCRVTGKTLKELIIELRDGFSSGVEYE